MVQAYAFTLDDFDVVHALIAEACLAGIGAFLVSLCFARSRRSCFDIPATQSAIRISRIAVLTFVVLQLPLLFTASQRKTPIEAPVTRYPTDKADSWNYGYGRPVASIITALIGVFANAHPFFRWVPLSGMTLAVIMDSISAVQLEHEADCVDQGECVVVDGWTHTGLLVFMYRDLVSIGSAIWGILLFAFILSAAGCCRTPFYTYQELEGGLIDRVGVMHDNLKVHGPTLRRGASLAATKESLSRPPPAAEDHSATGNRARAVANQGSLARPREIAPANKKLFWG